MKVIFTGKSLTQLANIYAFYKRKSPTAAVRIYNQIIDEIEILKTFPQLASFEPLLSEKGKTYRSLVIRKLFKAVYYIHNGTIYISDIWDCRQSPSKLIPSHAPK